MADTIREQIIKDAVARAGQIRIANGYSTDIGWNAERALKTHDEDTEAVIVVIPRPETSEKTRFGKMTHTLPLDMEASIRYDRDREDISELGEAIYGDLIKAMTNPKDPFCTLIESITHTGGGGAEMPKNEDLFAYASANFEIKYQTKIGNPYVR